MSFPRAKIKRFNEITVSSPSPAKYNVDLQSKPKYGIISQCERFTEPKSPSSAISEAGSTHSTPCFRTPCPLTEKKVVSKSKSKTPSFKQIDQELLNEKIVECRNKDSFIKELTEQLEEFKTIVHNLKCKADILSKDKQKFEKEISALTKNHTEELEDLSKKHELEIINFKEKISQTEEELNKLLIDNTSLKNNIHKLKEENEIKLNQYTNETEAKNSVIADLEFRLKNIKNERDLTLQSHKTELENIQAKHKEELENVQYEMLKSLHEAHKLLDEEKRQRQLRIDELKKQFQNEIRDLKLCFKEEKEVIKNQNNACIKQLEENMSEMRKLSEIQATEKCAEVENYWKGRIEHQEQESAAILKECQAISEYNIIQSEIEKNDYKSKFETKTRDYKVLERKYDDIYVQYKKIQSSYSNIQNKLYRIIKELREKEAVIIQVNKLLNEKQTYETTILRCQETIDILKRRLRESDQDVEQLKNEIHGNEVKLLEYEQKFNILATELKETQTCIDELEMNNESLIKITRSEIETVKQELLKKVMEIKVIAEADKKTYREKIEKVEEEKAELLQFIKEQQNLNHNSSRLISEVNIQLEKLSSENSNYVIQIETLNNKNNRLQSDVDNFTRQKEHWSIERKELDFKIDIFKNELHQLRKREKDSNNKLMDIRKNTDEFEKKNEEKDRRITELQNEIYLMKKAHSALEKKEEEYIKTIREQKALIEPFRQQLEAYEVEMNNLQNAKDCIESEAKDLGIKYANMLGHQNHKQKIKYMVNLKTKNEDLMKANLDLESKLRVQDKKIERLKKENFELRKSLKKPLYEDKENIGSPNRSFKCESPGPLKEIN